MSVYVCVPKGAVQDLGDHFNVELGDGGEITRTIMAAMANPGMVCRLGDLMAVDMGAGE